jgi:hypothetical protein
VKISCPHANYITLRLPLARINMTLWKLAVLVAAGALAAPPLFESERSQLSQRDLFHLPFNEAALFRPRSLAKLSKRNGNSTYRCKVYPSDPSWPPDRDWQNLNDVVGDRLLKPRPQAAVCYDGPEYDGAACAALTANWTNSYTHINTPLEMMSPVLQGLTCMPPNIYDSKGCTQGGLPMYVVNATTPKHVQAAVNFARNTGVRLVIKNTGHCFLGKSGGAESLSIWTHYFKDIEYIEDYRDEKLNYDGPAFKCGVGVQAYEIYKAAYEKGKVVVGGEGQVRC